MLFHLTVKIVLVGVTATFTQVYYITIIRYDIIKQLIDIFMFCVVTWFPFGHLLAKQLDLFRSIIDQIERNFYSNQKTLRKENQHNRFSIYNLFIHFDHILFMRQSVYRSYTLAQSWSNAHEKKMKSLISD